MAAVRSFAAVHLIGLGSTVTAQNLVITVIDLSGAFVPGANIRIVWLPGAAQKDSDWLHYAFHASEQATAHTDATGEATVGLAKGNYAIAIVAQGFRPYFERIEIRDQPSQSLRATLVVGSCTQCVEVSSGIEIPVEHVSLNIFIPLEPLQTITVTNARVRRRWLRF